jgi:hypothetical protein
MYRMRRLGLVLLGLISTSISYSQKEFVTIERSVNEYYVDTLYSLIDFHYSNKSNSALVLWIEKDNRDSLSDSKLIKKHFFTRKGDWYLMQILWDGNVASFVPGLFDSFIKIIKPDEKFTVSILQEGGVENNTDLLKSLERHIVIVKAEDIKGLQIDSSIDMFIYKAKSVIIFANWLK